MINLNINPSGIWWDVWQVNPKTGTEEWMVSGITKAVADKKMRKFAKDEHLGYTYKVEKRQGLLPSRTRRTMA